MNIYSRQWSFFYCIYIRRKYKNWFNWHLWKPPKALTLQISAARSNYAKLTFWIWVSAVQHFDRCNTAQCFSDLQIFDKKHKANSGLLSLPSFVKYYKTIRKALHLGHSLWGHQWIFKISTSFNVIKCLMRKETIFFKLIFTYININVNGNIFINMLGNTHWIKYQAFH